jgi:hypothetical protein
MYFPNKKHVRIITTKKVHDKYRKRSIVVILQQIKSMYVATQ